MKHRSASIRAVGVIAVLVATTQFSQQHRAIAEVPAPTLVDALCRKDLHKTTSSAVNAALGELVRCHKTRLGEGIAVGTDCNDLANALSATRVAREAAKIERRADTSCSGTRRAPASAPSVLGFTDCPSPCDSVVVDETYASVADCLTCLASSESELATATVYGDPAVPSASAAVRCQNRVGAALRTYVANRMKRQEVCQTAKDNGDLDISTDCRSHDPDGRIARAETVLVGKIGDCSDVVLASLDGCGTTTQDAQACVLAAGRDLADAIFDAVYPPIPGPATPTPEVTPTATPSATPEPVDCVVSDWSVWSACSATCGGGTRTRTRTVTTQPANGGAACPVLEETTSCNTQPCPVDCVVSDWSAWSQCSATCGGGTRTRTRTVTTQPAFGGAACPVLQDTSSCNEQPCPVDCVVSDWSAWSQCSATCGGGTQTRTRTITTSPANGGAACPTLESTQSCNTQPCPVDCVVSAWSAWSQCSATCGGGTRTRTRTITTSPANGGTACPVLQDTSSCNEQPCPVDCVVSAWSPWSVCSATCGGGTQTRTRTITTSPANGGAACPTLESTQSCNTQPCPVDCVVSDWSEWSACSAPCDGGTQTRTRTITTPAANGGAPCPTLQDTNSCNTQPCP